METDISKKPYNGLSQHRFNYFHGIFKHKRTGNPHANSDDGGEYFVRYLL